jgi:short-subunit dehydrogenase
MTNSFNAILKEMGSVDTFIYTPGFYQEGNLAEISLSAIEEMIKVGLHVPIMLIRELLHHQTKIPELVLVTSTSQFVPREKEPVYTAVKAGLGQLGNSLSLDPRIEKTLVVAPAGMKTRFWKETNIDTKTMLSPAWVAGKIIALMNGVGYSYLCAKILREPPRIELIERR